jgi:hypothetical protein
MNVLIEKSVILSLSKDQLPENSRASASTCAFKIANLPGADPSTSPARARAGFAQDDGRKSA